MSAPSGDQTGDADALSVPDIGWGVSAGSSTLRMSSPADPTNTIRRPSGAHDGYTPPEPKVTWRRPEPSALATHMLKVDDIVCPWRIIATRLPSGDQLAAL